MNLVDTLFSLTMSEGVSGDERACVSEKALALLKKYTDDAYIDSFGNVIGNIGERSDNKPHVLLDAHIDEIGFIVSYITDDGFLKVSNCGGIDRRLLSAQQVTVFGKKKLTGVICSIPPHLSHEDDKVPKISDICIDIGMTKEEASEVVSLGDRVVLYSEPAKLLDNRVTSRAIDDRCGVLAILNTLELLKGKDLPCSMSVVFSTQEEVGERGAKVAAYSINPDVAIAVDVSFALTADDSEVKCGKLSEGVMIGVAPALNRKLSLYMIELAKKNDIPYQIEVMGGTTGTNADAISVTGNGVKTVTLSIPEKYMHTPVEVIDIADIEATSKLIEKFILSGGSCND